MVQFVNVEKQYDGGHIAAVKQASFKINEGEFVFLIGPSGSGKTTIIKMLIRDVLPSSGKIYFNDVDITKISRNNVYKLRREIGIIFQDYKLVPEKTAFENVAFAMEAAGKTDREIKETVPYVLDIVGLSDRMLSFPEQLSGGEQQRVAIARAIANNPKILIADEPTGNLDPASSWDIVQILSKINNWGTTVIMSTHGTDIVNSLNKRVIQMENGEIIRDDSRGQYEMTSKFESKITEALDKKEEKLNEEEIIIRKKGPFKVKFQNEKSKEELKTEALEITKEIEKEEKKKFSFFGLFGKKENPKNTPTEEVLENNSEDKENSNNKKELAAHKEKLNDSIETQEKEVKPIEKKKKDSEKLDNKKININNEDPKLELTSGKNLKKKLKTKPKLSLDLTSKDKSPLNSDPKDNIDAKFSKVLIDELDVSDKEKEDLKKAGYTNLKELIEDGPDKIAQKLSIDPEEVIDIAKAVKAVMKK